MSILFIMILNLIDLTAIQKTYLKDFVDSFERMLYSPGFKDQLIRDTGLIWM